MIRGRRRRGAVGLAAGVAIWLLASAPAQAATHLVNFDQFPDMSNVPAGTAISSQYPGVVFPDSPPPDAVALSNTSSEPNALRSTLPCPSSGPCPAHRLPMNFSPSVSSVSLNAGDVVPSELGGTFGRLVGYSGPNGTGTIVAESHNSANNSPDFELGPPVTTAMSMTSFSGNTDIASAVLYVGQDTGQGDQSQPEPGTIDDLRFVDSTSPPPPPPGPPSVTLSSPAPGTTFQNADEVQLAGHVSAPAGVDTFCEVLDGPPTFPASCSNIAFVVDASGNFSGVIVPGLTPGTHTVTVWVRDSRGATANAAVTINVATPATGIDLRVNNLEVTQAAQNLTLPTSPLLPTTEPGPGTHSSVSYNGVGLAAHGITAVRVYANAASLGSLGAPAHGVRMLLYGFAESMGGITSLGPPINPLNGTQTLNTGSSLVGTAQRLDPNAYTFELPDSWTTGRIRLVAVVNPPGPVAIPEANRFNNAFGVTGITFTPTRPVYITPIQFTHTAFTDSAGNAVAAAPAGPLPTDAFTAAFATTPLAAGQFHVLPYAGSPIDVTAILRCNDADRMAGRCSSTAPANNRYNDLLNQVNQWRNANDHSGKVYALGYNIGGVTESGLQYALADIGRVATGQRPLSSIDHELGHMFGLRHSSYLCGGGTGGQTSDPSYPDQFGLLNGFGFDRRTFTAVGGPGTQQDPLTPARPTVDSMGNVGEANSRIPNTDLMTYCYVFVGDAATWLSPINWQHQLDGLKVGGSLSGFEADAGRRSVPFGARLAGGELHVTASVPPSGPASVLDVRHVVGDPPTSADPTSSYHVVVRDASGATLSDLPVTPHIVHSDRPSVVTTYIDAVVPAAGAQTVQILAGGNVIAQRARSAHAPDVRVIAPRTGSLLPGKGRTAITWALTDADGDPLQSEVDFSADNGRTWRTLTLAVAGNHFSVANSVLSRSAAARLRVIVNDGFNDTTGLSGRLRTTGAPPVVRIDSPSPRLKVTSTASVVLSGEAYDDTGRSLAGASLTWFDGRRRLGSGPTITVRGLTPGRGRIRLVAGDRFGRRSSATSGLTVTGTAPSFLLLTAPAHLAANARFASITVAADVTAVLRVARQSFAVGPQARPLRVRVPRGRGPVHLALRLSAFGQTARVALTLARG
jgi:hypothetical protein